ncbi:amidohydrolase family protein [Algiphilus sp.]|uniref:amidohydrolase family protein n=1 Tax=Algiphilus sp. TaxID=1872431 RepID=UPI0025B9FDAB|nr:amidohydrolase family protein [Algiphilus sp.]MCK5770514.1 amidohydrolase [Algiphilus sp.]
MEAIDVWAQITTPRMAQQPWLAPLLRWTGQSEASLAQTPAETVAEMDAAGVSMALLSAWYGPAGALISNDEVRAQMDAAPARFRGLASADLTDPMRAVRELRDCLQDERFVGVRMVPWLWDLPPNDRRYYPVYAACIDAGVPFCTQIGHTGPLRRSETGRLIPYLEDVMLDFPELTVVGGHVGFPWLDELMTMSIKFPNFHVDTSAYALARLPPAFVQWMKGPGAGRAMFGSNWPMLSPARCLAGLDQLGLDDEQRAAFLAGNARRVFTRLAGAAP